MDKDLKVVFMPGCFDDFEGTQEELDELIATIKQMAESGELFEQSMPLDEETEQELGHVLHRNDGRTLQ